jgi:hypothetical protein
VDNPRPRTSWGDAVTRIDVADYRSARRIHADLRRAAEHLTVADRDCTPLERRRLAGLALVDALAAYRLAGGTLEHLHCVLGRASAAGQFGDVAGCVGDRARVARARAELALRTVTDDNADEHAAHVADVEQRAAALERPRPVEDVPDDDSDDAVRVRIAPGDLIVRDYDDGNGIGAPQQRPIDYGARGGQPYGYA